LVKGFIGAIGGLVGCTLLLALPSRVASAEAQGTPAAKAETVEDRIRPVGQVRIRGQVAEEEPVAEAPAVERTGKQVVDAACAACHATGAAGAPKIADKGQWSGRLDQGFDTLAAHAINGFKGMPARGGNPTLTDMEVKRAVAYLVEQVGMKVELPAPEAKTPAVAPAAAPAAVAAAPAAAAPREANLSRGENMYKQVCAACHQMGVAGAPKVGDSAAWAPRVQQGLDALNQNSLKGIRGMPPKGGRVDLPDDVILDAVAYMVKQSS
jgi:cytochrome c5